MTEVTDPHDWSVLFVCVVGPRFDSTSPSFVSSRASHATGSDGRLAQKRNRDHVSRGRDCVDVCSIPTSSRLCHLGTQDHHVVVGPTPLSTNGGGVQQPFRRTPVDGIPHLTGIRTRWLTGGPPPFNKQVPHFHKSVMLSTHSLEPC